MVAGWVYAELRGKTVGIEERRQTSNDGPLAFGMPVSANLAIGHHREDRMYLELSVASGCCGSGLGQMARPTRRSGPGNNTPRRCTQLLGCWSGEGEEGRRWLQVFCDNQTQKLSNSYSRLPIAAAGTDRGRTRGCRWASAKTSERALAGWTILPDAAYFNLKKNSRCGPAAGAAAPNRRRNLLLWEAEIASSLNGPRSPRSRLPASACGCCGAGRSGYLRVRPRRGSPRRCRPGCR